MKENAEKLLVYLEEAGFEGRFVGGCVRDQLLGVSPKDFDLATDALPQDVMEIMEKKGIPTIPLGLEYGTVGVLLDGKIYEITSLREDIETDGRHARVLYTKSFQKDAARRDFTINALSMDRHGQVFDYDQGREDLALKIIRFVGDPDQRIVEDYLRILRCFRFACRLGFEIPGDTLVSLGKHKKGLERISWERKKNELDQIFSCQEIGRTLGLLLSTGVWEELFGSENPGTLFDRVQGCSDIRMARWALVQREGGILEKFPFSKKELKWIQGAQTPWPAKYPVSKLIRWIMDLENKTYLGFVQEHYLPFQILLDQSLDHSLFKEAFRVREQRGDMPLGGQDILSMLDEETSPRRIGEILRHLQEEYWDGLWNTKDEGIGRAIKLLKSGL
jgi:tRNA nucleotidyltransferase/poly(A) polymerase